MVNVAKCFVKYCLL